jgi:hypothetical protein
MHRCFGPQQLSRIPDLGAQICCSIQWSKEVPESKIWADKTPQVPMEKHAGRRDCNQNFALQDCNEGPLKGTLSPPSIKRMGMVGPQQHSRIPDLGAQTCCSTQWSNEVPARVCYLIQRSNEGPEFKIRADKISQALMEKHAGRRDFVEPVMSTLRCKTATRDWHPVSHPQSRERAWSAHRLACVPDLGTRICYLIQWSNGVPEFKIRAGKISQVPMEKRASRRDL